MTLRHPAVIGLLVAVVLGLATQGVWDLLIITLTPVFYGATQEPLFASNINSEQLWLSLVVAPISENVCFFIFYYALLWKDWRPNCRNHALIFVCVTVAVAFFSHARYNNIGKLGAAILFFVMTLQFIYYRPRVGGPLAFTNALVTHIINNAAAIAVSIKFG